MCITCNQTLGLWGLQHSDSSGPHSCIQSPPAPTLWDHCGGSLSLKFVPLRLIPINACSGLQPASYLPRRLGGEMGTKQCLFSEAAGNLSSQDQLLLHWWPRSGEQQDAGKTRAGSSTAWMCEVHGGTRKEAARWVKHRQTEAEATAQPFSKAIKFPLLFKKKRRRRKNNPHPTPTSFTRT